ncbi:putative glycosaminoglycan xylosylkinase-like [Penaeus vannamei]|uniref:Putative glycosaminoglycan xylosylkinase-like n=1 Tax=Penaeus vannamei TaxID=6689 RepID=A0A3R7PGC2_PENVA|nr:putative glycosaminoglycan xylosylkinase-like [Penaeus vannamei]
MSKSLHSISTSTGIEEMEIRLLIWALCCALLLWILRVSVGLDPPPRVPGAQESRQPVPVREIYCKEGAVPQANETECPGLVMLSSLFAHLPAVRTKYSSESQHLVRLIEELKKDIMVRGVTKDHWGLARKWASPTSLVPEPAPGLGDILAALSSAPVTSAAVATGGSQFKIILRLEGNQKVMFIPKLYSLDRVIIGKNRGGDRFNGEIAAFHLSRLLGLQMAPIVAGRTVSLEKILPVAAEELAKTFFKNKRQPLSGGHHPQRRRSSRTWVAAIRPDEPRRESPFSGAASSSHPKVSRTPLALGAAGREVLRQASSSLIREQPTLTCRGQRSRGGRGKGPHSCLGVSSPAVQKSGTMLAGAPQLEEKGDEEGTVEGSASCRAKGRKDSSGRFPGEPGHSA